METIERKRVTVETRVKPGTRTIAPATDLARLLFLHGGEDGKPVSSPERLSELSGASVATIRDWFPTWRKEREELAVAAGNSPFGLSVTGEVLQAHRSDLEFLRRLQDNLKAEIAELDSNSERLAKWIDSICKSPEDRADAFQAMRAYGELCLTRKALIPQLLSVQARLTKHNGVDAMDAAVDARGKTLAAGKARLDLKREEGQANSPGNLPEAHPGSRDSVFTLPDAGPEAAEDEGEFRI